MIKNQLKKEKGISLVSLTITVIVLLIITNILIYSVSDNMSVGNLKNMQNDINNLRQKVSAYYSKNGRIPAKIKYTNVQSIDSISSATDIGDFYIIDLSALENLTLNYGEDYKNINSSLTQQQINEFTNLYIINETSHNIFYVNGINVNNNIYYTYYGEEGKDTQAVDLRYVENIQIPSGYSYLEGTKSTGIKIKSNANNAEYIWIVQDEKLENIPNNIQVQNEEEFKESVNIYKGYYKSTSDNSVIYLSMEEEWTPTYDKSGKYKDKNNNIVTVPRGFQVCTTPKKNTVEDGLIIRNPDTNDRYVWIEVPRNVYLTANSETDYENIETDLQNYTSSYKDGQDIFIDKWYAIDGQNVITEDTQNLSNTQKQLNNGCGLNYDEYVELRNNMYKSIYKNGGFWLGQYEAGVQIARENQNDELSIAKSKQDLYPYNFVTCSQAQAQAENVSSGDFTSSLMFGIQWDLVLKFIETKSDKIKYEIATNSLNWGNYYDSQFTLTGGEYTQTPSNKNSWKEYIENTASYVVNQEKLSEKDILLTTGAAEGNKALNIYDLAGNVSEWTLEYSGDVDNVSCIRGGSKSTQTNNSFSSIRIKEDIDTENADIGFRITLF